METLLRIVDPLVTCFVNQKPIVGLCQDFGSSCYQIDLRDFKVGFGNHLEYFTVLKAFIIHFKYLDLHVQMCTCRQIYSFHLKFKK